MPEPALRAWDDLCLDPPLHLRIDGGHLALHENEQEFGHAVHSALVHLLGRGGATAHPTPATASPWGEEGLPVTSTLAYPPPAWNATAGPYRTDVVPARLIVEAAHRAPDAPAVLNGSGVAYTYGGLLTAANRLARLLQQRGLGPGDHVGVIGRRRPDTVVALLGVALSGATFVPCHPDWPALRLGYVLGATARAAWSGPRTTWTSGTRARREPRGSPTSCCSTWTPRSRRSRRQVARTWAGRGEKKKKKKGRSRG